MKAIILAAGLGTRLHDRWGVPKCLQAVGGVPLLHHQIAILSSVEITDVVVVVGHRQEMVRASMGGGVEYVVNESFGETNSMYSFLLAAQEIHDDVVVMNGDVFFHPVFLSWLVAADGDALLYDSTSGYEDEHMKVRVTRGCLAEMSKILPLDKICGENVGILRLTRRTVEDLVLVARDIVAIGGQRSWLSAAVSQVAQDHPIECLDIAPWPWVEIDFPADLARARMEVLPAVASALAHLPAADPVPLIVRRAS